MPVIDDIVVGDRVQEFLGDLRSRPVYFVLLLPCLDTLRERNATREKVDVFHESEMLDPVARQETPGVGLRLDTSDQTVAESFATLLERLEEARIG